MFAQLRLFVQANPLFAGLTGSSHNLPPLKAPCDWQIDMIEMYREDDDAAALQ